MAKGEARGCNRRKAEDKMKAGRIKPVEGKRDSWREKKTGDKGSGWEYWVGKIKPQTKDFLSPHEISMAQLHTHAFEPVCRCPTVSISGAFC